MPSTTEEKRVMPQKYKEIRLGEFVTIGFGGFMVATEPEYSEAYKDWIFRDIEGHVFKCKDLKIKGEANEPA